MLRIHQRPVRRSHLGQVAEEERLPHRIQMPVARGWYFVILAEKQAVVELELLLQIQRVAAPEAGRLRWPSQMRMPPHQQVLAPEQQHCRMQRRGLED